METPLKRLQKLWARANSPPEPIDRMSERLAKESGKNFRWMRWAEKILNRRGIPTSIKTCAYRGKQHWVKEVHKIGGGYWFLSAGCSGCSSHLFVDSEGQRSKKMPTEGECALLDFPILSVNEPKVGEVFTV